LGLTLRLRRPLLILGVTASSACGGAGAAPHDQNASRTARIAGRPAALLASPRSICGTDDLQPVNSYDGALGQSVAFTRLHKTAVGALTSEASQAGDKFCSGTLVGPDLFLTAAHCTDADTVSDFVAFNYEDRADGPATQEFARVTEVVDGGGELDVALLRLEGAPGKRWGWTGVSLARAAAGDLLTIIQHPLGGPKQLEVGHLLDFTEHYMRYGDLDTEPGSSGSGVLDAHGTVIGVHTNGGCTETDGANSGVRLDAATGSAALAALAAQTVPFVDGDDIDLVVTGQDGARMLLAADPETGRVGLVPAAASRADRGMRQWRVKVLDSGTIALLAVETARERTWILTSGTDGGVAIAEVFDPEDVGQRWRILPTEGGFAIRAGATHDGAAWSRWLVPAGSAAGGIALARRAELWDVTVQTR
jgi:V8-like Glu-specific endopeptidase